MPVKLESIVPWGRSMDEYVRCFALSEDDWSRSILDCAAGPSSFNAEMKSAGRRVVSIDPIFELSPDQISRRVEEVRQTMIDQVRQQPGQFVWEYVRSPEHLEELRFGAMRLFLQDFSRCGAEDRYRVGGLPNLDVGDGEFPLALCSHFLFLYSDQLDEAFHLASVRELLRVAKEVRIFPVTDLSGNISKHLAKVQEMFGGELVTVNYEFLKNANQMLKLTRKPHMLNDARLLILRAAIDRIIPADEFPGAWDAGVGQYITRLLQNDLQAKSADFLAGLDCLDAEANKCFGKSFGSLSEREMDDLLERVERGDVSANWLIDPRTFFALLVELTAEGYYSDPGNGGNRDGISWRMIGYDPGANRP